MTESKILLAIPCFNCSEHISIVLHDLHNTPVSTALDVVIIDNKSEDLTRENIRAFIQLQQSPYLLFENEQNYGLGGSFKIAFEYAKNKGYDWMIFLHGDNQAPPYLLPRFFDCIREAKQDVLLGSRFAADSKRINYSPQRIFGNKVFNFLFSLFTGKKISDIGSGLNAFRIEAFNMEKDILILPDEIVYDAVLLLKIASSGRRIKFVPIDWHQQGQVSTVRDLNVGMELLKILFYWRFNRKMIFNSSPVKKQYQVFGYGR